MNETQKTGILAAITAVVIVLAVATRPVTVTKQEEKGGLATGELLFKDDALDIGKAASLKITKFDENKLSMESFEVVKDKTTGLWKIPSEYDYPADAEEQLKNATAPLTDLRILNIVEDAGRNDQPLYGVVEPSEKLEAGVTGVGMLVSVGDAAGKTMASLIVGKQVDKAQENLHYVRIPNQDPIYTVELDPAVFDTNFKKWIKPDLLQVKSFDITGVGIRDYQIERTQTGGRLGAVMSKAMEADMSYDTGSSKWKLDRMVTYEGGEPKTVELGEDEELKSDKLNALRTAAQSLQIVGVRPKPKGLAADLKADKTLLGSDESMLSLFEQGFIPQSSGETTEIFAVAGETLLNTQDGVRYTLRFGEERVSSSALEADSAEENKDESATEEPAEKRERYLLVTASLDESRFPPPDLQAVPETIEDLKKLDAEKAAADAEKSQGNAPPAQAEEKPAEEGKAEEAKTEEAKPEEAKSDESGDAPADESKPAEDKPAEDEAAEEEQAEEKPAEEKAAEENDCGPVADDDQATDEAADQKEGEPAAAADKPVEDKATDAEADNDKPAADKPAEDKPADKEETEEELKDRLSVVQGDITKANQRLIDARNEKINAARKKVQELNARFADWYYLIEESSFKQLMLKRDDLVGPKGSPAAAEPGPGTPGGLPNFPGLPPLGGE